VEKKEIKREKRQEEDLYYEKEKKYAKLDEQTEMFHNWINQTKESMEAIKRNWQSEEGNVYLTQIEEEVNELQQKNLKLAEENEEERRKAKKEYLNKIEEIEKREREEQEGEEDDNL